MKLLPVVIVFVGIVHFSEACQGLHGVPSVPSVPVGSITGGGGGGGGSKKRKCLHVDNQVLMADGTVKKAGDLLVGDQVWDENGPTSVVLTPNFDLDEKQLFIRFKTENGFGTTLTPHHAIFAHPCGEKGERLVKRAGDLTTGECVPTKDGKEERVVEVSGVQLNGRIQPITESGKIIVDGVMVSCYDYVGRKTSQQERHASFEPARLLYGWAEKIYNTVSDDTYAFGMLEGLIRGLGLEKLYYE